MNAMNIKRTTNKIKKLAAAAAMPLSLWGLTLRTTLPSASSLSFIHST